MAYMFDFHNSYYQAADAIEDLQTAIAKIKEAQLVAVLMTDEFVTDKDCSRMFHYVYQTLRKYPLLILTKNGRRWQTSEIGVQVADFVCGPHNYLNCYYVLLKHIIKLLLFVNIVGICEYVK